MAANHQNIIEINGKRYDAVTGHMLNGLSGPESAPKAAPTAPKPTGGNMDGVVKSTKKRTHGVAAHVSKHTQKSHTLMRSSVHKPGVSKTTQTENNPLQKSHLGSSKERLHKAHVTPKSTQISRFGDLQQRSSVIKKVQELPVEEPLLTHAAPSVNSNHQVIQSGRVPPSANRTETMLDRALASASSHEQPAHQPAKKRRKVAHKLGVSGRTMAISMTVLAGVILGGFFAVQNVPNLSMRVAAARAGFNATMPSYKPSGFSFNGPISYSPGQVTVSFKSNTDDRAYDVTQRASNWNSDALLANFVVAENKQYQTYLDRGRTLYIYDGSNATWVDNGVWYQVEGRSDMTTDQLVRIAASI